MKREFLKAEIKHISGCTFVQQKNISGFIVKETTLSHYISFADLYRGHNYSSSKPQDDDYTQDQFFALADFLNDRVHSRDYYQNIIYKDVFLLLWNACVNLTPDRLVRRGYFKPEFYKPSFSFPNDCGLYKRNGESYEVIKVTFNDKTVSLIESYKEVTIYCKNNKKFTIDITHEEFRKFMGLIQLSLLVHLKDYAERRSITVIKEDPQVCINKAVSMNIL